MRISDWSSDVCSSDLTVLVTDLSQRQELTASMLKRYLEANQQARQRGRIAPSSVSGLHRHRPLDLGAYALVLLHLLKGDIEGVAELLLAHPQERSPKPDPSADMNIDRIVVRARKSTRVNSSH